MIQISHETAIRKNLFFFQHTHTQNFPDLVKCCFRQRNRAIRGLVNTALRGAYARKEPQPSVTFQFARCRYVFI